MILHLWMAQVEGDTEDSIRNAQVERDIGDSIPRDGANRDRYRGFHT